MNDALNVDLEDDELNDEIGLVTDLMVEAARSEEALDQRTIDAILGVAPR